MMSVSTAKSPPSLMSPHGHAGHRALDGNAGVHQGQAGSADARHGAGAVGFGDLGDYTQRVGEGIGTRHDRQHPALGQATVADLAPLGTADPAGLTDAEGRKIVVEHEGLASFALQGIDDL